MSDKVVVRFLKAWRGYSADELAGFDSDVVEGLKLKGFAEAYEGNGTPSKPKPAKASTGKPRAPKPSGKPDENADGGTGEAGPGGTDTDEDDDGGEGGAGDGAENTENTDDDEKP